MVFFGFFWFFWFLFLVFFSRRWPIIRNSKRGILDTAGQPASQPGVIGIVIDAWAAVVMSATQVAKLRSEWQIEKERPILPGIGSCEGGVDVPERSTVSDFSCGLGGWEERWRTNNGDLSSQWCVLGCDLERERERGKRRRVDDSSRKAHRM